MCNQSKRLAVLFIIAMAISSLTFLAVKNADAKSTYTLSTPEFTVKYADHSGDTPTTTYTTTDPYTGETKTHWQFGQYITNRTLDLTVKNQAYPTTVDGHNAKLQYIVLIKGHFSDEWRSYGTYHYVVDQIGEADGYTQIAFPLYSIKAGDQIDVKVCASVHVYKAIWPGEEADPIISDYSEVQTVTIPNDPVKIFINIFPIIAAIIIIAVLVLVLKKNGKRANKLTSC